MSNSVLYHPGDGYLAWLQYRRITAGTNVDQYAAYNHLVVTEQDDVVIRSAVNELTQGMEGITGRKVSISGKTETTPSIIIGTFGTGLAIDKSFSTGVSDAVKAEGYALQTDSITGNIAIGAATPAGVLYGVFHLLRIMGTGVLFII